MELHLLCYRTLHVSGIFSAHHQEFSTVHSALVSFMQVFDDRFQAESGWNCRALQFHPDCAWKFHLHIFLNQMAAFVFSNFSLAFL